MFAILSRMPFFGRLLDITTASLPFFSSPLQQPLNCIHSPEHRECWRDGFDIHTDYELEAPLGKLVEYDFTISNQVMSPDGYLTQNTVVNGQFPGPTVEADWGDTIRITVRNNLTNHNGTSIHWHGIRQLNTNYYDGVPGVTQCPDPPGALQVYEFKAMQYGTAWYHSHLSLQYTNGILGPIHIRGPSSMNYDTDLGPLLLSDWYHADAFSLFWQEILSPHAPLPVSTIMNGKGVFECDPALDVRCTGHRQRHEMVLEKGKRYKLGIVNTGSLLTYKFWIDGHNFTVIQTDFVPIQPYTTDVLMVGIAQRYEIVIEANADFTHGSNFWMHAVYCDDESFPVGLASEVGVVRYNVSDTRDPYTPPESEQHPGYGCQDIALADLVPIVPRQVGRNVNSLSPIDYLKVGLQQWPNVSDPNALIHKWALANRTQYIDWRDPALKNIYHDKEPPFEPDTVPVTLDYEDGEWVYFVIENNYTLSSANTPRTIPRSVHPIHLHGHDFVILAQDHGQFTKDVVPILDNPPRRDTVNCPIGGYVWIAFQINNPGTWLMHCHIAWHASAGLSLQFIEQRHKIKGLLEDANALPGMEDRCERWKQYYEDVNIPKGALQDDSGI